MSDPVYFITLAMIFGTIILVFGMRYYSAIQQARSRVLVEGAYRALAEKALATQSESTTSLAAIQTAIAEIRISLGAIESVLKTVE